MCFGLFPVCENHPPHVWQLRKGREVRDWMLARGAEDQGMQEDAGWWSIGICPMSDLLERRAAPQTDPSSFLSPGPWPGHPMQEKWPTSTIGPPGGDHRDGRPKTFHRKEVLGAMASLCFQAKHHLDWGFQLQGLLGAWPMACMVAKHQEFQDSGVLMRIPPWATS